MIYHINPIARRLFLSVSSRLYYLPARIISPSRPLLSLLSCTHTFTGVNCVGPLLFTTELLPQLRAAAKDSAPGATRVVWSSSMIIERFAPQGGVDLVELDRMNAAGTGSENASIDYAMSKAGNWVRANHSLYVPVFHILECSKAHQVGFSRSGLTRSSSLLSTAHGGGDPRAS